MKNTLLALLGFTLLADPLAATAQQSGDFTYSSDGSTITITGYTGPGGAVTIPATITGLPVTTIGDHAFASSGLTSVTIPGSVTTIGDDAFAFSGLTSVTIPGSVTSIAGGAFFECSSLTNVTISNGLASIGNAAFHTCFYLTSVTIPNTVTNIGSYAFYYCIRLKGVFFKGNAPGGVDPTVFYNASPTVYYLPGSTGWGATFDGVPALLWNPLMQSSGPGFGVGPAGFGFNITGTADIPIVVEACTNLANANWVALQSLNLTNGAFYFSDPNWTNYPARNYRIRSP